MGVEVYIWDYYVGALVKNPEGIAFQYSPAFKKTGLELSPINLPINGKEVYNEIDWKATGGVPELIYDSFHH